MGLLPSLPHTKLFTFMLKKFMVKNWYGTIIIKVEDGKPTTFKAERSYRVDNLPE